MRHSNRRRFAEAGQYSLSFLELGAMRVRRIAAWLRFLATARSSLVPARPICRLQSSRMVRPRTISAALSMTTAQQSVSHCHRLRSTDHRRPPQPLTVVCRPWTPLPPQSSIKNSKSKILHCTLFSFPQLHAKCNQSNYPFTN